jgi:uncharacterized protein YcbK (DUF882 family)
MPRNPTVTTWTRRDWLQACGIALAGATVPGWAGATPAPRRLAFYGLHTGESLQATYWTPDGYEPDVLARIDHILRDHRTGEVLAIDTRLLDLLSRLRASLVSTQPLHVISGYRSPATNAGLRQTGEGVAKHSLHVQGKAIDIRVPGVSLRRLHRTAVSLAGGGVGYYERSQFVHIDVGRVRYW